MYVFAVMEESINDVLTGPAFGAGVAGVVDRPGPAKGRGAATSGAAAGRRSMTGIPPTDQQSYTPGGSPGIA